MTPKNKMDYMFYIKKAKKDITGALGALHNADLGSGTEARIMRAAVCLGTMDSILSKCKATPETKDAIKQMRESSKILKKQLALLISDDTINQGEYSLKVAYSGINGINQALHLYAITADVIDLEFVGEVLSAVRYGENVYSISAELNRFAKAKQNWGAK